MNENREKVMEALAKLSDEDFVENIDMYCKVCPATKFCSENCRDDEACDETMLRWIKMEE